MSTPPPNTARLSVTVVSTNSSTLEGLETYLHGAGVVGNSTREIESLLEATPPSAAAIILFPDEYHSEAVSSALAAIKKQRPSLLLVIVTNEPLRFDKLARAPNCGPSLLVMPKPAWAWTILDAVRARLEGPRLDERRKRETT